MGKDEIKALKLAIQVLRGEIQKIAYDANVFDKGLADYPYSKKCSKRRADCLQAIKIFDNWLGADGIKENEQK